MCIRDSLGGVLLEIDQLKELDLIPLRGEDQLVLLSVEAHFEGDLAVSYTHLDVYKRQAQAWST